MNEKPWVHVYPTNDVEHFTDGAGCWCSPRLQVPCTACDGDDAHCFKCRGTGWAYVIDLPDKDMPCVILHNGSGSFLFDGVGV